MRKLTSSTYPTRASEKKQHNINYPRLSLVFIGFILCNFFTHKAYAISANADTTNTLINTSVNISVLNNDYLDSGTSAASSASVCLDPQFFISDCSLNEMSFNATYPENGTLSINGKTVIYTPNEGYTGTDSFIYTAFFEDMNGNNNIDDSTVTITINAAKPPTKAEQKLTEAIDSLCNSESEYVTPSAINTSEASDRSDVSESCTAYNNLSETDKTSARVTLAADQVTAGHSSTVNMTRNQSANISSRLTQVRNNSTGLSVRGLTINNYDDKLDGEWLQAAYTSLSNSNDLNHTDNSGGGASSETNSSTYTPFGYFINGSITFGDKESSATERGYDIDANNYTLGMDYRYSDKIVVGAAYGYSSSSIEFDSTGDDMDNQINNLFMYGSLYDDNYFVSATLGYAFGEIDTSRRILIPGTLDTQAKGSTDTNQFILQLNSSYDISQGALSFGPYAKLDIIEGEIKRYTETNGGGFEVAFDSQDISSQLITIGGQAQYSLSYSWGVLLPSARFELKNELNDSQNAISGRFLFDTANSNFSITAEKIDSLWYVFGTGLSAVFPHGLSAYVDLETTAGLNNIDLYTYSYGGRWELSF